METDECEALSSGSAIQKGIRKENGKNAANKRKEARKKSSGDGK